MRAWFLRLTRTSNFKRFFMGWMMASLIILMALDTHSLYFSSLRSTAAVHDRLLHATAQQIADMTRVEHDVVTTPVPLALIEALEGSGGSHMFYRVVGFDGSHIAGDLKLPLPPHASTNDMRQSQVSEVDGVPVQMVVLRHPVETSKGHGMVTIMVAETLEARHVSASQLLHDVALRQLFVLTAIILMTWLVVKSALSSLTDLGNELKRRPAGSTELITAEAPHELRPVVHEINALLQRQQTLLDQQQRLIADASHQLRTPISVLKTQLQSALSRDAPVPVILNEMLRTVDRVTHLTNQLLKKARVQHMLGLYDKTPQSLTEISQNAALEMSPLIAAKRLNFSLDNQCDILVTEKQWVIGELIRNLLSNAIRHTPVNGHVGLRLKQTPETTQLTVWDTGTGLSDEARATLFQPFSSTVRGGTGLGLSICQDIVHSMGGNIDLRNRVSASGGVKGLAAVVKWPRNLAAEIVLNARAESSATHIVPPEESLPP